MVGRSSRTTLIRIGAPALEELYNLGPHRGNLAFEIGNPDLKRELGNGFDFGIRHNSKRVRFEANGFYYHIKDFIFLAPTGDVEDGLTVAEYDQGATRYAGAEARLDTALHPAVWLNLGLDYVNAELTSDNTPLPRIPPLRGRVGLEFRYKGLLLNPEIVMANHQDRIFPTETPTAGYAVFNISGSYLFAQQHAAHIISFNFFNVGDTLYRNHLSFIKEFAPEMGRGLRVTYTLRFSVMILAADSRRLTRIKHFLLIRVNLRESAAKISLNRKVDTDVSHARGFSREPGQDHRHHHHRDPQYPAFRPFFRLAGLRLLRFIALLSLLVCLQVTIPLTTS